MPSGANATEAALRHAFGSSTNSIVNAVNGNLGRVESFLADPGTAGGGKYDWRAATSGEMAKPGAAGAEAFWNPSYQTNTIAVVAGNYLGQPGYDRIQTQIHEPLHPFGLAGFRWGGSPEAYRANAMTLAHRPGGTASAIYGNPDNYACFVVPTGC